MLILLRVQASNIQRAPKCDTPDDGYQCQPGISHYWGQYSPFFAVPSEISPDLPRNCKITFAQILSRHGARDPTASKTISYNQTIQKIKSTTKTFRRDYAFLADYEYTLGADQLTAFGEQEMVNSGIEFFHRYNNLAKKFTPFVRASSENRVVVSAQKFDQGYNQAKTSATGADTAYPYPILVISENIGSNNTYVFLLSTLWTYNNLYTSLNHGLCTDFETKPPYNTIASAAQKNFASIFLPPITARLNADLAPVVLSATETIYIMDLCPFNTVASPIGAISPFCNLFSRDEWRQYDYYQTLGKYYGYGAGNPLGPTQGVGFVNELIARLTNAPVQDHTSVNQTLDSKFSTFPTGDGYPLFADFSHDNDLTSIYAALGLYSSFAPLSNTTIETTKQTAGYSAAWTVPFAARMYVEKMKCDGDDEEKVRVVINNRVVPLVGCPVDTKGRCGLKDFVKGLDFARGGGKWDQCFV